MAETIIDGTQFNPNDMMYSGIKAHASGGKVVNIMNRMNRVGLRISTPLILTWGAAEDVDKEGKPLGKYSMALQFPNGDYGTEETSQFLDSMKKLEQKVKDDALTYSKEWFGKQHKSNDIIDALFNPMLRYPKIKGTEEFDYSKAPTLKLKVPLWNGVWKSEIYDEDGESLFPNKENPTITPLDYLKKGATVACVIQCGGIWFVNGKFSVTWNLMQAVVQKPKDNIQGKCMIKLKAADKEKLKAAPQPEEENHDAGFVSAQVADSDDEDNELPVTPAAVTAPPLPPVTPVAVVNEPVVEEVVEVKKKKTVVKKKTNE
jgi:hypothetical protein